jgi:hypothetical protein
MGKFSETIEYNGEEIEVSGNSWPEYRGYRNSFGAPEEEDEDAGYEIEEIIYKGVDVFSLMDNSMDEINELLEKKWRDD